jgi:hypothetical protein
MLSKLPVRAISTLPFICKVSTRTFIPPRAFRSCGFRDIFAADRFNQAYTQADGKLADFFSDAARSGE